MKTAFIFSGQGAQYVGMGKEFYEQYEVAKNVYKDASKILGRDIEKLCFESDEIELAKTSNTQLAVMITSIAILEVLKEKGICANITCGLSLGEYTALYCSGALSFEDVLKLVSKRSELMQNKVPNAEFGMAAVLGMTNEQVIDVCKNYTEGYAVPVNFNCPGQVVISGYANDVQNVSKLISEAGAKKVIPLKVSGPFHTKLLQEAADILEGEIEKVNFNKMSIPVISNLDGNEYPENPNYSEILSKHITNPVHFDKCINTMIEAGVECFIEIGPGKTLSGFVKKINSEVKVMNIDKLSDLNSVLENLGGNI